MTSNGHDVSTRYLCSIEDTDGCRSAWVVSVNCRYPWYFTDSLHELSESIMTNCNVIEINTILRTGSWLLEQAWTVWVQPSDQLDKTTDRTSVATWNCTKSVIYCLKFSLFCFLKESMHFLLLHVLTESAIVVTESYIYANCLKLLLNQLITFISYILPSKDLSLSSWWFLVFSSLVL